MARRVAFFILTLAFGAGGALLAFFLLNFWALPLIWRIGVVVAGGIVGFLVGMLLSPRLIEAVVWLTSRWEQYLQRMPLSDLLAGIVGLVLGLLITNLFAPVLSALGWAGKIIWLGAAGLTGYLGFSLGVKKREEFWGLISSLPRPGKEKGGKASVGSGSLKLLDTSAIIDGRIADLCASGFLEGTLVVPVFVLEELQHIADSGDTLRRNRGRRGLDILNRIKKETGVKVQICDQAVDGGEGLPVDAKLVRLAKKLGAKLVTTDYNLHKVAELQGVKVLNINELAQALRPVVLPGEEMSIHLVKDGKEPGQGVGYLEDGTMVVVEGGKKYIGQTIRVTVTSVLQTSAGRMIFAKPKAEGEVGLGGVNAIG
ncbi:PilT protein domain protein [Ammonifex degensii KC4]|uniref:PilT protein domain protein n=1 Tax=Ammonifex degensii (strain DSM 10501 / KC4) TaxID=429009 RepID=C9RBC6_AMMDK|nr:PIN domain-containing protein [Ammonifex degensii]ACX51553.1 PilT protein domain protein [Ammonifex degensii KC4]